ncbi:hypothetical protein LguiB_030296 [Lonicera macranthoides]
MEYYEQYEGENHNYNKKHHLIFSTEDAAANANTETTTNQQSKRLCPQCFKGFSSGKALGGHMRIHAQAAAAPNKQQQVRFLLKKQQKILVMDDPHPLTTANNININDESKPTCSLCGKSFPSKKSLFGHMRCHPDREWRGIQPPPAPPRTNSPSPTPPCSYVSDPKLNNDHQNIDSSDSAANDDHLTKYVTPGWSVTDRRGRKALRTPRVLVQPSSVDDDELRGDLDAFLTFHEKIHRLEAKNYSNSAAEDVTNRVVYGSKKKQKTELFGDRLGINKRANHSGNFFGKALVHEYFPEDDKDDESDSRDTELLPSNDGSSGGEKILMVKSNKKKRKVKLMADLESTEEGTIMNRRYRCDICNKGFPSHQALGGHRSSHNKFKVSIINTVVKKEQDHHHHDDKSRDQQKSHQQRQHMVLVEETHQCKICNKSFLTGQALGGHQRCHWTPPQLLLADELPAPTLVTSSAEASQITERRVVNFDLNEMPPTEEDNWDS